MRAAVITVSDGVAAGVREDRSGAAAAAMLESLGFEVDRTVIPDGIDTVEGALRAAVDADTPLVVTTGGTGMSPRDLTPEGTLRVVERVAPGIAEAMRASTFGANPHGMLSRGVCGVAGSTLIVNLPGSVTGVDESLAVIAPALAHAVALIRDEPTEH